MVMSTWDRRRNLTFIRNLLARHWEELSPMRGKFSFSCLLLMLASAGVFPFQKQKEADKRQQLRLEEAEDYYQKWLNQDVLYIITDEEKATFQTLTTPEEKEQFIEQFWLRRDADPRTAINEFKEEHYRRIAYANEHFTSGDPGWMTDRGRIYIIHGQPDSIESRPTGGTYVRPIEEGGGTTGVYPYEKWRYKYIEGLGQNVELEFVDSTYTGKYQLAVYPWEKDALLHSGDGKTLFEELGMSTRAEHPGLMPAAGGAGYGTQSMFMRVKDTPFARYELHAKVQAPPVTKYKDLKELVQVNIQYANLPIKTRSDYFRLNEAQILVPVTVQLQNSDLTFKDEGKVHRAKVAVYGIVTSMTNRIITEFEDDFSVAYDPQFLAEGLKKTAMYQRLLTLEVGTRYKLDLVLKDLNSGRIGVIQKGIIPPAPRETELSSSSLVLSSSIHRVNPTTPEGEMFVLGDLQILPSMDKRFTPQMPLGVYVQIYNAAFDQTSLWPSLRVTYKLLKDGELLRMARDERGESTYFFSVQRVVLLKQLSLAELDPGEYQVQVEVVDNITNRQMQLNDRFSIVPERQRAGLAKN